jgi:hypothetical protein
MSTTAQGPNEASLSDATSSTDPTETPEIVVDHHNRLSRPGPARITFYFTNALAIFWVIGFLRARRFAAHQFLAENSHRLPTSDAGWYLYHRAKNYRVLWRGFTGGIKYGLAGGACAFVYGFTEEAWDQGVRGGKVDAIGSVVAGTTVAGVFAFVRRMRMRPTLRCLRVGAGLGFVSGVAQDLLRWSRGAPPWYVEELRARRLGETVTNPIDAK